MDYRLEQRAAEMRERRKAKADRRARFNEPMPYPAGYFDVQIIGRSSLAAFDDAATGVRHTLPARILGE